MHQIELINEILLCLFQRIFAIINFYIDVCAFSFFFSPSFFITHENGAVLKRREYGGTKNKIYIEYGYTDKLVGIRKQSGCTV